MVSSEVTTLLQPSESRSRPLTVRISMSVSELLLRRGAQTFGSDVTPVFWWSKFRETTQRCNDEQVVPRIILGQEVEGNEGGVRVANPGKEHSMQDDSFHGKQTPGVCGVLKEKVDNRKKLHEFLGLKIWSKFTECLFRLCGFVF